MNGSSFEIGFVLAGAISAGAYTAGVMDFIIEALDAYDEAKRKSGWDGPTHDVRVPVLAGASAGGMTAAITALHAFRKIDHVWPGKPISENKLNRLYSSWVTDIDIERLLDTTDLAGVKQKDGVKSLLCCDVLDRIVDDAFRMSDQIRHRHWTGRGDDHSLRVLLTVTNLRGVPYSFKLFGNDEGYGMLNHGDYIGFVVGADPPKDTGFIPVDVQTNGPEWTLFKAAALATGAFPIGLKPRQLDRKATDYFNDTPSEYNMIGRVGYEDADQTYRTINPEQDVKKSRDYRFLAVDGGTIDNEPLEIARRYLAGHPNWRNPRDGDDATKAVLLVDPFPNVVEAPEDPKDGLVNVVTKLGSSLLNQARFKPEELKLAEAENVFSRFVISPERPANNNKKAQEYPIASGVLGGFGGFLHKSFRRHDYLLGRRNAQAFLRWHFGLPETNTHVFSDFRGNREKWHMRDISLAKGQQSFRYGEDSHLKPAMFLQRGEKSEKVPGFPIIPLAPELCEPIEIGTDDRPRPELVSLSELRARIEGRASKVLETIVTVDLSALEDELKAARPAPAAESLGQEGGLFTRIRQLVDDAGMAVEKKKRYLYGVLLAWGARRYGVRVVTKKALDRISEALEDAKQAFRS